jgi:integrase
MPRRSKGPRLWLQPARRDAEERILERPVWVIRDGSLKRSTGLGEGEAAKAQTALAEYILARSNAPRGRDRDPAEVRVADVISIYSDDVVAKHARPHETAARLERALDYFGDMTLDQVNRRTCQEYVAKRGKQAAARRELEDLRSAIRHHWAEGLCAAPTPVVLPPPGVPRERFLSRSEAARLIWAAWRQRQKLDGKPVDRPTAKHVARFILVALYSGTRAAAICGASLRPTEGRGLVDLERGVFYRRAPGQRETKKRQPPIRLPDRLLAHLRRWSARKLSIQAVVEWNGKPVKRINKAFRSVRKAAGLGPEVVPHVLRHTCATWGMQARADHGALADYLGMTVETLRRVYGHHDPDYLADVRGAVTARPNKTARAETPSTVVPLAKRG